MRKFYAAVETTDGAITENVRIYAADRIRAAAMARTRGIPWEDGPEAQALLIYAAMRRTQKTDALEFDDFLAQVIDFQVSADEDEDPTTPTTD